MAYEAYLSFFWRIRTEKVQINERDSNNVHEIMCTELRLIHRQKWEK